MKRWINALIVLSCCGCERKAEINIADQPEVEAKEVFAAEELAPLPVDEPVQDPIVEGPPTMADKPLVLEIEESPVVPLKWTPSTFSFAIKNDGHYHLVLDEALLSNEWEALSLRSEEPQFSAEATLEEARIPLEYKDLIGREFALYGFDGVLCTGRVEAIVGLARANDVFEASPESLRDAPDEELARSMWRHGNRLLTARLAAPEDGICTETGVVWGREVEVSPPILFEKGEVVDEVREEILAVFRDLSGYQTRQEWYVECLRERSEGGEVFVGPVEDWPHRDDDEYEGQYQESIEVIAFVHPETSHAFVQVFAYGGCDGNETELWAIFSRNKDEDPWELVSDPNPSDTPFRGRMAADINLDGMPEFLSAWSQRMDDEDREFLEQVDGVYQKTRRTVFPFYGCRN